MGFKSCGSCLFYELDYSLYYKLNDYFEWCHFDEGHYSYSNRKLIQSIYMMDCENYKEDVEYALSRIEYEKDITILYAVESGSRAWGFSNDKSDYDIRFIYKRNKIEDYIRIDKLKDVITVNDGLYDIVGWDVKKAFYLHYKNNPNLREWMISNYVYIPDENNIFKGLPEFDDDVLLNHYYHIAKNHWKKYCDGTTDWLGSDEETKMIKKYLYVIRSILCWKVIEDRLMPVIDMSRLVAQCYDKIPESIVETIVTLINYYQGLDLEIVSDEIENLNKWIIMNLEYMGKATPKANVNIKKGCIKFYNKKLSELILGGE